jgi:hypothetical protein
MYQKKAQLSVETMIIYGLVILVTLSVIGALMYFNVLELESYLPDRCNLGGSGDLKCEEMKFSTSTSTIELGIRNIGQKPIETLEVNVKDDESVHFNKGIWVSSENDRGPISSSNTLSSGDIARVVIHTDNAGISGKVLTATLTTNYNFKEGAIIQEAVGNLRIKAS